MSFFLIVWNMEIYMHDIVNVEFLPENQSHTKKGPSSEKDWPSMLCLSFK